MQEEAIDTCELQWEENFGLGSFGKAVTTSNAALIRAFKLWLSITYFFLSGIRHFKRNWFRSLGTLTTRFELEFSGMLREQFSFLLKVLMSPEFLGRDHSLWSLRTSYFRNFMNWGLSVSTFISLSLCISNLSLRLGNNCLSVGKFVIQSWRYTSLLDKRWEGLNSLLSLNYFLALLWSIDSVATRLLAFWYTETAFLLYRLAFLGLKVILGVSNHREESFRLKWVNGVRND